MISKKKKKKIQSLCLTNFRYGKANKKEKNCNFLVQITACPSQLLIAFPLGGLFSFLEQKSAAKALKTCYFAYFSTQWGGSSPFPLATLLDITIGRRAASIKIRFRIDINQISVALFVVVISIYSI